MPLLRKLLPLPAVVLGAAALIFLLPRLAGVDTVRAVLRSRVAEAEPDPAVAARVAAELGLDRPLPEQFLRWLGHVLTGDLGLSYATRTAVAPQLASALGVSAVLTVLALALAAAIGILSIAGLSFLGLGVQPPTPEWGVMLAEGRQFMFSAPELVLLPAATIVVAAMGCHPARAPVGATLE